MRISVAIVVFFLALPSVSSAQTSVCGFQQGARFTLAGSPYTLTCNYTIPAGDSLVVAAGVQLNLNGNSVSVNGKLRLRGTQQDSVFITNSVSNGAGVYFQATGTGTINYTKFSGLAGTALTLLDGLATRVSPAVTNSRFVGNGIDIEAGINTTTGLANLAVRPVRLRASSTLSGQLVAYGPVSAYQLVGTIQLASTDSLVVAAGVQLNLNGNSVSVNGKLRLRGTPQDSVFITNSVSNGAGVYFQATGVGTVTYTSFRGLAGTALTLLDGATTRVPPAVTNSRFAGNGIDIEAGVNTTTGLHNLAVRPVRLRANSVLSGQLAAYGPVSAYQLTGTLSVPSTDSLVVAAGVRLNLNGNSVSVNGKLRLRGTQQDSVFVTNSVSNGAGIYFQATGTGTVTYTKFSGLTGTALTLLDGLATRVPPVVTNSRFTGNGTDIEAGVNTTTGLHNLAVRPVRLRASSTLSGQLVAYGPVSAYQLVGTIQLASTDSLVVAAGVQLNLNGNSVSVNGKLRLRGTPQDSVFITNSVSNGGGIFFQATGTGTINYAKFSGLAGTALTLLDGTATRVPPTVTNSRFASNGIDIEAGINTTTGLANLAVRPVRLRANSTLSGRLVAYGPISAYQLTGTLSVPSTDSLVVAAGVRLNLNGNSVSVNGKLRLRGTQQDSVFVTNSVSNGAGIFFQSIGTGTVTYTKFSGLTGTALTLLDGATTRVPPVVTNSRFTGNGTDIEAGVNTTTGLHNLAVRPVRLRASSTLSGQLVAYGPVSAYQLTGTLSVPSTDSLVVVAGVRLNLNGNSVSVNGRLRLRGTQQDSVFITNSVSNGAGIFFQSTGTGTVAYTSFRGLTGTALTLLGGTGQNIHNCLFSGNAGVSVSIPATQTLRLDNLKFANFQTAMAVSSGTVTVGTSLFDGLAPKFGINATGTSSVVAINCNFGHPSGPYNLSRNPTGLGCQITNNVCLSTGGATPVAGFDFVVNGNDVVFVNTSANATSYSWNFGNGTTSALANPLKNLPAGTHNVCLTASIAGAACASASICKTVSILGLSTIEPNHGGNAGAVSVVVTGAGFVPNMQLLLRKAGYADIASDTVIINGAGRLTAGFDLTGKPMGQWDVVAVFPNGTTSRLANGFTVENGTPSDMWVTLTGDYVLRVGFSQVYTVAYGNNGNNDAVMVPLVVQGLPVGTEIEILDPLVNLDSIPYFQPFTLPASLAHTLLDSASNTTFRIFYINKIRASSSGTLSLVFHLPSNSPLHAYPKIKVILGHPLLASLDGLQRTTSTSSENCLKAIGEKVADKVFDKIVDRKAWGDCAKDGAHFLYDGYKAISGAVGRINSGRPVYSSLVTTTDFVGVAHSYMKTMFSCASVAVPTILAPEAKLLWNVGKLCLDAYDGIDDVFECGQALFPEKQNDFAPITGNAWDPNTKYGPGGGSFYHYINKDAPLGYSINFENSPLANLNAQIVRVTDTLSAQAFDLGTFAFTSVTAGTQTYALPSPAKSFVHDFDFVAQYGVKARVVGTFEASTGIARWTFFTIDPATNQVTTSALTGFLPPDVVSPRGQGYVSFICAANPARQTGDVIHNRASIVFDFNPAILTNVWANTFDLVKPVSAVTAVVPAQANTLRVSWSGTDTGSGIQSYDVYYTTNGRSSGKWLANTSMTTSLFVGHADSTYCFRSVARDSAGNVQATTTPSVCRAIPLSQRAGVSAANFVVYPNPTAGLVTVEMQLMQPGKAGLVLTDVVGRVVYSSQIQLAAGKQRRELDISKMSAGVYFLQLTLDGQTTSKKLLKE